MDNVFISLLAEYGTSVGSVSLFESAKGAALNMDKTLNSVASRREARSFAMNFCQMIKNSTDLPIGYTYPDGTSVAFNTKAEIVADCGTNFATYYVAVA